MKRLETPTFAASVPDDWDDVTAELEDESAPSTLGRADGPGALQVSVALYQSGGYPNATEATVVELLDDFVGRQPATAQDRVRESTPLRLAAATFHLDPKPKPKLKPKKRSRKPEAVDEPPPPPQFLRVWYLSDGGSFAFATYTCDLGEEGADLAACEEIVRSLTFLGAATPPPAAAAPSSSEAAPTAAPDAPPTA